MTETIINLNQDLSNYINSFKQRTGIKSDDKAILEIISEFKLNEEEKELAISCAKVSEKSLGEQWNSKEDDKAFAYLQ
ncbi:MAG: hypothetical protein HRU03_08960 [Nanoarchaeales archaeon]|nr:hypothetical protein [Nanoarchaeales archaeon]